MWSRKKNMIHSWAHRHISEFYILHFAGLPPKELQFYFAVEVNKNKRKLDFPMDSFKLSPVVLIFLFLVLLISTDAVKSLCCFDRIFIFGDSMTDTGNGCPMQGGNCQPPPYGETYFHKRNGRWCDGRLIVDFIGMCQIKFLWPYLCMYVCMYVCMWPR